MTKELIASWGVEFDAVNIAGNDDALREMIALGAPLVPAVAFRGKIAHGWNPKAYAELLGIRYTGIPALAPADLGVRLDTLLARLQAWLRQTPTDKLKLEGPGRKRELRQLGFHVFRLSAAFVDSMEGDGLQEAWLQEEAPPAMRTGADIAAFGDGVRTRIKGWFAEAGTVAWQEPVWTYYGDQSAHELLERTTWHSGQHVRQIHALLSEHGVIPAAALDPALFDKLPLPKALW